MISKDYFRDKIFPGFPSFGTSLRTQGGVGAAQLHFFPSGKFFLSTLFQKIPILTPMCLQVDQVGEVTEENEKEPEDSGEEETKV